MARSSWKFKNIHKSVYKNIFLNKFKVKKLLRIFSRGSVLTKSFFKKMIQIYKGEVFTKIILNKYNLGFRIGEFAFTRKSFSFPPKKTKKKR